MPQSRVFISGKVQGVGYRYFVKQQATMLGLKGWVRNTEDGEVEAVFQGERQTIEEMIELCKKGPFIADVKQVGFEWEQGEESFSDFVIKNSELA